jgi:hypothetical protein
MKWKSLKPMIAPLRETGSGSQRRSRFFEAVTAVCLLLSIFSIALAGDCRLRIGTNLAGPADWGSEWPFVDIMKFSRSWISFNSEWVEGGENPWDTGVTDRIPADENGYPLELPFAVAGTETTQAVRTVWANTSALQEGVYTILYDGEGTVDVEFDGSVVSREPGRILFRLTRRDNILSLNLLESRRGDHVRNIRVLMPGTEATYTEKPWCAEWLEKLEPFRSLRFMDWGLTNNSTLKRWDDRPRIGDYTYTLRGVPYEWMIDICNLKKADCWVCIPHEADDDYIRKMAELFRDGLDPSLKIYVEYSNEIWNWMFDQTSNGRNGSSPSSRTAWTSGRMCSAAKPNGWSGRSACRGPGRTSATAWCSICVQAVSTPSRRPLISGFRIRHTRFSRGSGRRPRSRMSCIGPAGP